MVLVVTLTPGNGKILGNYLDKVVHFLLFFNLSIQICRKFHNGEKLFPALLWAVVLALMTEVLQQKIPGRNMEVYDAIADILGIFLGYYFGKFFWEKQIS